MPSLPKTARPHRKRIGIRMQLWLLCGATTLSGSLAIALAIQDLLSEQERARALAGLWGLVLDDAPGLGAPLLLAMAVFAGVMVFTALAVEPTAQAIRRQRQQLRQQASDLERLALVARRTSNSVLITDEHSRIQWINDGFTRLWG